MRLKLVRSALKDKYTIGHLYVNGAYVCDTLELPLRYNGVKNVQGKTCIPYGVYEISMNKVSPSFGGQEFYKTYANGGRLPRIEKVPGRDGILIHVGNFPSSTKGCVLVGLNKEVGQVLYSKDTFKKLYRMLYGAVLSNDPITIEIV